MRLSTSSAGSARPSSPAQQRCSPWRHHSRPPCRARGRQARRRWRSAGARCSPGCRRHSYSRRPAYSKLLKLLKLPFCTLQEAQVHKYRILATESVQQSVSRPKIVRRFQICAQNCEYSPIFSAIPKERPKTAQNGPNSRKALKLELRF